jgi:OOP family OmpA-OmpF porin
MGGIADALGVSGPTLSGGIQSAIGTLLGGMATKTDNPGLLRKMLDMVPSGTGDVSNLAASVKDPNSPLMSTGKRILSTLFGGSESALTRALGAGTGMQPGVTSSLLAMAGPMVMSFLGRRVRDEGMSMAGLGDLLQRELPAIRNVLPAGVTNLLWPQAQETIRASPVVAQTVTHGRSSARWLIPLVLLCLIPFVWLLTHPRRPVARMPVAPPTGTANRVAPEVPKPAVPQTINLYFVTGSMRLNPESEAKLKEFVAAMRGNEDRNVMVKGYTDNVGNADSNMRLSQQRADAVKSDLVGTGIAADHVTAQGLGEENFIADNATAEGRATNRRVTVEVGDHWSAKQMQKLGRGKKPVDRFFLQTPWSRSTTAFDRRFARTHQ